MNGVQTRFKCKLDVKRCKRFVFPPSSLLPRSNALKTKAIRYFQTDRTLTRIVSPPLFAPTILFFEIQNDTGKGIINVTLAYLIGQYLKTYGLPENMKRHSREILSGSLAGIFILNTLLTAMSGNIILRFARDNNLLIIIASIMIFYQFTRWHFSSRIINYLAGYVFALYMLQGLLIHCLQPWYVPYADSNLLVLYFMGTLVSICLTTLVIEWSRRLLLGKIENKLANAIERRGAKIKMFADNH